MLKKLIPIAATFVVTAIVVTIAILGAESMAQDREPGLPYNVDGTWTPEYFPVSDSEGNTVGVVKSADAFGEEDVHPHPVYSLDNHDVQVGWVGEHGYWALGGPKAWCTACIRVHEEGGPNGRLVITDTYNEDRTITRTTERTDNDGNTTKTVEIITEGTDGPPGPTGSVND